MITEKIPPDSQCGFCKRKGCTDIIFVAKQLVEKYREHDDTLFVLFVDLRKAFDSVPRFALYRKSLEYHQTCCPLLYPSTRARRLRSESGIQLQRRSKCSMVCDKDVPWHHPSSTCTSVS